MVLCLAALTAAARRVRSSISAADAGASKRGRPPACYPLCLTHYPVFLDLKDRPVLVVGAGKIALRKTKGLLDAHAKVTVVSPDHEPEFDTLPVRLIRRRFRTTDLTGMMLVFAATSDRATNHRIGIAAKGRGLFANIADSAEECDFVVPARVTRGNVQIAVSTGGENPRLSAELRKKLEDVL
jgi:precorrin-2 dehydrogenase/sirohydrochlorin ferrochelatase